MANKKTGIVMGLMALLGSVYAQDSYKAMHPEFSADVKVSNGAVNLDGNKEYKVAPGISSDYDVDLNLKLKGGFTRASEWAVEKENGITMMNGIGFETGISCDMAKLYQVAAGESGYTSASDVNHYSLIQPMIDWYETNMSVYGLPANPCDTPDGSMWPTTVYASGDSRYQFIHGSTVESASDVLWTTVKWDEAEKLYQEIKGKITDKIDHLNADVFATGDIGQFSYQDMSEDNKKLAELKMKAKREFSKVSSGSGSSADLKDAVSSAYFKVANIFNVLDARFDFLGKRLTVGNGITSYLAGQTRGGSAVTLNLKKGLVKGLEIEAAAGVTEGTAQNTEDYDTMKLDYWRGISGEFAAKLGARYSHYFESLSSTLTVRAAGIMSDLLVANQNFAVDGSVSWISNSFVSYGITGEAMYLNWKNRLSENDEYKDAYSILGNVYVGAFGATLKGLFEYKSENFTHATYNTTEDRFRSYSLDSDYYLANLEKAAKIRAELEFNPKYFLSYDLVNLTAGYENLLYGENLESIGTGFFCKLDFDLKDMTKAPVNIYGNFNYFKNDKLPVWSDMKNLPDQEFMEFAKFNVGVKYQPVEYFELSAEYTSAPSYSRLNTERISSFTINGTLKFN